METAQLIELETQVDQLMQVIENLKFENSTLKNQIASSARERSKLQLQVEKASAKVKRIIRQLKEQQL